MMATGSIQLNRYRSARRNGRSMMDAAIEAGIGIAEARLTDADEAKAALAEGREMWARAADPVATITPESNPPIPAPEPAPQPKDEDMARGKKKDTPINGEVPKPDFELADRLYDNDIAPANADQKRAMKTASEGWKTVKKDARVHVAGYRQAMTVSRMERADQQAWLRSFNGGLKMKGVTLEADLVDKAEGKDPENVVPIGKRERPGLATLTDPIPPAVDGDADLADDQQQAAE